MKTYSVLSTLLLALFTVTCGCTDSGSDDTTDGSLSTDNVPADPISVYGTYEGHLESGGPTARSQTPIRIVVSADNRIELVLSSNGARISTGRLTGSSFALQGSYGTTEFQGTIRNGNLGAFGVSNSMTIVASKV